MAIPFLPRILRRAASAAVLSAVMAVVAAAALPALPGTARAASQEIVVSAAASLTNAFNDIKAAFEKKHPGTTIRTNYAASTPLLKQMLEGAPVDVLAVADQATMDRAAEGGVVDPATRRDFARSTLVLIVPRGAARPAGPEDLRKLKHIATGNPDGVPAGRYARESLTAAGLWDALRPQVVMGSSVRQVLDYVARGEADAGFVYGTDAAVRADRVDVAMTMTGHSPILYPIAAATTGANPAGARLFVDFVLSAGGMAILEKHGFARP